MVLVFYDIFYAEKDTPEINKNTFIPHNKKTQVLRALVFRPKLAIQIPTKKFGCYLDKITFL